MTVIYLTGLSGVGASFTLQHLETMGYKTVDTDYGYTRTYGNNDEVVLNEEKLTNLLMEKRTSPLFISGCYSNQGKFYEYFDHVVLLKADLDVMLERVRTRTTNPYGKHPEERAEIIENYHQVLPLLEKRANVVIDTTNIEVEEVCRQLLAQTNLIGKKETSYEEI